MIEKEAKEKSRTGFYEKDIKTHFCFTSQRKRKLQVYCQVEKETISQ